MGIGRAAAVVLRTGVLGGGALGLSVAGMWDTGHPSTIGQLLLAIDPAAFGPVDEFFARVRAWREEMTSRARQDGVEEILVPGDKEWRADERQRERVELVPAVIEDLARLAVERRLLRSWRAVVA